MSDAPSHLPLPPLVVVVGATAVGKTALSLTLCARCNGEVMKAPTAARFTADMDIGTAKATPAQRRQIPHHLIDLRNPDEVLTVAEYQSLAYAAIDDIHRRGCVPLLVGGTALYVRAVGGGAAHPQCAAGPGAARGTGGRSGRARHCGAGRPAGGARPENGGADRPAQPAGGRCARWRLCCSPASRRWTWRAATRRPTASSPLPWTAPRAAYAASTRARSMKCWPWAWWRRPRLLAAGYAPALPAMTSLGYRER